MRSRFGRGRVTPRSRLLARGRPAAGCVDELVFFDPVLRPLGIKRELLAALLLGPGWARIGAGAAAVDDLIRDALVVKPEMAVRFRRAS